MSDKTETIETPVMYKEVEQEEDVARGCVKVYEIIMYGKTAKDSRKYFCQDKEDLLIFKENNPGVKTETFYIQLLKSSAIKYLNDPENMKQFIKKETK